MKNGKKTRYQQASNVSKQYRRDNFFLVKFPFFQSNTYCKNHSVAKTFQTQVIDCSQPILGTRASEHVHRIF